MRIQGTFYNKNNSKIDIVFENKKSTVNDIVIGQGDIYFSDNPCEISSSVNDTFDVLLQQTATIRLLTKSFIRELFSSSALDISVTILQDNRSVFEGFVEPQAYTQPYNEDLDEIEISCICNLSVLQYLKYPVNVGTKKTFKEIINAVLNPILKDNRIIWFDSSKKISKEAVTCILDDLSIADDLFSEEGEEWMSYKVLLEILKYLNLHITMYEGDYYIFDWDSMQNQISWIDINDSKLKQTASNIFNITTSNVADISTSINICEIYNKIIIHCTTKEVSDCIENPLGDKKYEELLFVTTEKCIETGKLPKEYYAEDKLSPLETKFTGFIQYYLGIKQYGSYKRIKQRIAIPKIDGWEFSGISERLDTIKYNLKKKLCAIPFILNKIEESIKQEDNSKEENLTSVKGIYIANNWQVKTKTITYFSKGHSSDGGKLHEEVEYLEKPDGTELPLCRYYKKTPYIVYSPRNKEVTNYLVISGKILLQHIEETELDPLADFKEEKKIFKSAKAECEEIEAKERDFDKKLMKGEIKLSPGSRIKNILIPYADENNFPDSFKKAIKTTLNAFLEKKKGLGRFTKYGYRQSVEFQISDKDDQIIEDSASKKEYVLKPADKVDHQSYVPILQCLIRIGDKCLRTINGNRNDNLNDFVWVRYRTREECKSEEEYYDQTFSIGIDPKIGDFLIGQEYELKNNVTNDLKVGIKGIAIPIKAEDELAGDFKIEIIKPLLETRYNNTAGITYFSRLSKGGSLFFKKVKGIFLKDFAINFRSDNGKLELSDNIDIEYTNITLDQQNSRSIEFLINSALTLEEAKEMKVKLGNLLSTPFVQKKQVYEIYNNIEKTQSKPEKFYIEQYISEFSKPRVELHQNFIENNNFDFTSRFIHPSLATKMRVLGIDRNLTEGTMNIRLKEYE